MTLALEEGTPTINGSYVVHTNDHPRQRVLVTCMDGKLWHPLSDQQFRHPVLGFVGPLPALYPRLTPK
jgi:Ser/Thr protein kinase RdoA (MazF antagonist)